MTIIGNRHVRGGALTYPRRFTVTADHIALLRRAYVVWEGAPAIYGKKPYGNSDVASDVAEILGWPFDDDDGLTDATSEAALRLHAETEIALQIFLATGEMRAGEYFRVSEYNYRDWKPLDAVAVYAACRLTPP